MWNRISRQIQVGVRVYEAGVDERVWVIGHELLIRLQSTRRENLHKSASPETQGRILK